MGDFDPQVDRLEALIKGDVAAYTYGKWNVGNVSAARVLPGSSVLPVDPFVPADLAPPAASGIPANPDIGNVNGDIPAYIPDILPSVEGDDEGRQLVGGLYFDEEWMRAQDNINNNNNNNNNAIDPVYFDNYVLGNVDASTPGFYQAGKVGPLAAEFALGGLGSQPQLLNVAPIVSAPVMPQPVAAHELMRPQNVRPQMPSPSPSPNPSEEDQQQQQGQQQQQNQQNQPQKEEKPWEFAGHVREKTWVLEFREVPLEDPNALLSEQLKAQYPEAFEGLRPRQPSLSPDQLLPRVQQAQQPSPSPSPPPAAPAVPEKRGRGRPRGSRNKVKKPKSDLDQVIGSNLRVAKSGGRGARGSIDRATAKSLWQARTPGEKLAIRLVAFAKAEAKTKLEVHLLDEEEQDPADGADVTVGNNRKLSREQLHWQLFMRFQQEALDRILDQKPQHKATILAEEGLMEELFPGHIEKE